MSTVMAIDNEFGYKFQFPYYFYEMNLLYGLGICNTQDSFELEYEKDDKYFKIKVINVDEDDFPKMVGYHSLYNKRRLISRPRIASLKRLPKDNRCLTNEGYPGAFVASRDNVTQKGVFDEASRRHIRRSTQSSVSQGQQEGTERHSRRVCGDDRLPPQVCHRRTQRETKNSPASGASPQASHIR